MFSAELSIILLNLVIILVAYLSVYPKLAGSSFNKISFYDLFTSGFAFFVVGSQYWGSERMFNLIIGEVNWFWFTLVTFALIEIPTALWYFKKHSVKI